MKQFRPVLAAVARSSLSQCGSLLDIHGKHILIACFPKSGSTYITKLLVEITGFREVGLRHINEHNEQDICECAVKQIRVFDTVTQQHVKGTNNNIRLIRKYGITPVVLVRNIGDVVISLRDHIERESHESPTGFVHDEYFSMNDEDKLLYLIRTHLPWYFNFFVSWKQASRSVNPLWISYERFFMDQEVGMLEILQHCGLRANAEKIRSAIFAMRGKMTRFNKGISGRRKLLGTAHRTAIADLAACWNRDDLMKEILDFS